MSLPAIVDHLEDLPEAARAFYVETGDGRFRLDAEGVEDVSGLKSALEKEREARKALKAELGELKTAALEDGAPEGAEGRLSDADPDAESVSEDPMPEPDPEPEPEPSAHPELVALQTRLLESEARAAILSARGAPELLLPVILPRLRVELDPETALPEVQVIDEAGRALRAGPEDSDAAKSLAGTGGAGKLLTLAELIGRLRADPLYARAFDGAGKSGSGAPAAGRGEGGPITVALSDPRAIARHVADIASGRVRVV